MQLGNAPSLRKLARLVLGLGALLSLAMLAGNSDPTCQPATPGTVVCLTAHDCGEAPACADNATGTTTTALGSWTCVDAACVPQCEVPGQCQPGDCGPGLGMPNWLCPDGSLGGPSCETLADGTCGWVIRDCPVIESDKDGDGFEDVLTGGDDCDDTNAMIHPGAAEACDYIDNDCDGMIDEGCFECSADEHCPNYWSCAFYDCADPTTGVDCGGYGGVCVADDPYPQACQFEDGVAKCPDNYECACLAPPDCAWCEMCYMGCVLHEGLCWDDGDCDADETCEGAVICPPGAYCLVADSPGECVEQGDPTMPCTMDSAGQYWCPEGYYCDTCLQDPDCPYCDVCWAGCVPYGG